MQISQFSGPPIGVQPLGRGPGVATRRRTRERGSALLIVFVFAAVIAIMLYRELPVTLFEAKRQKEELLVDRGHEYVRAIQLFYRRNRGQYPANIEQLENTNNIRYLRRKYKDPFTGKDDWRLLHAGPGGMLMDSQVNRGLPGIAGSSLAGSSQAGSGLTGSGANTTGTQGGFGQSSFGQSSFGQSSFNSSGFNNNGFGGGANANAGTNSAASTAEVVVPEVPTRAPAISASGGAPLTPPSGDLAQNPDTPLLPESSDSGASATGAGFNGYNAGAAVINTGAAGTGVQSNASSASTAAGANNQSNNPMQLMNPLLTSPSGTPLGTSQQQPSNNGQSQTGAFGQTTGGFGQMSGGALAGVASKATGHTIKSIEQQRDYSKWEFYYDPTKDRGLGGGAGQNGAGSPANMPGGGFGQQNSGTAMPSPNPFSTAQPTGQPSLGGSAGQPQQPGSPDSGATPPSDTQPDPNVQPQ